MKKYFNIIGGSGTDEGEYHIVQNRKVTTYEKRSLFRAAKVKHELPINQNTSFSLVRVSGLGPEGQGSCKLTTDGITHDYWVANDMANFIRDVKNQQGKACPEIKVGFDNDL